ncbi:MULTISPECIES: single-stranded DNA-binding protein [Thermomonas]|jgi:single-strand DNA-binding protein|uniref:single-stranded DNA-binding protein n=1 Tax=Thermomonas TaxID=141948 RepID=UPI002307EA83|nr:single-stranded DNA-binding protein [Thermomonas mangrovi]HMT38668.1 single-stranded DNA-binding protein [Thermomonas sp.]
MARGVNKVILVGNLGNDPDVKYTQGGMAITTLSLATTSVRKDRDGNNQEKTEWHRVKLFGKLGEIAGEYLKKGRQVYIEGRIEYGSYEKDGVKQYTTDIIADEMQMLGGGDGQRGGEGGGGGGYQRGGGGGGYGGDRPQRQPAQRREPAQAKPANFDDVPFDDDIPF